MRRRTFISAVGALTLDQFMPGARVATIQAESTRLPQVKPSPERHYEESSILVSGNTVHARCYGTGPAILMVHGFPRTGLMWRFLAPTLAQSHTVVCVDLRGYGLSGSPASTDDHYAYSKRAMAQELVEVMQKLGFETFDLVGHDRGARVSYRLALDHPARVRRLAVFDVIPIVEAWSRADARFAQAYWPWTLLAQSSPLPESYLLASPEAIFRSPFGKGSFGPDILDQYVMNYHDPVHVHAICEEFRAAATIDVEHDRADLIAGNQIHCPTLHLWARGGPLDSFYAKEGGPLNIWRRWAPGVTGEAVDGGHFFPEEDAESTARHLQAFLNVL